MAKAEQDFKAPIRDGSFDEYMPSPGMPSDLWERTKPSDTNPAVTLKDGMRLGNPLLSSLSSGDLIPIYDTSADALKRIAAADMPPLLFYGDTSIETVSGDDELSIYDISAGAYRKITAQSVADLYGLSYHGDDSLTSPTKDDELSIYDTSASVYKKITVQDLGFTWKKFSDPDTGWLTSKTGGWTADEFDPGGLEVDFSSVVPAGTKAVRLHISQISTLENIYYRKSDDANISNNPGADQEYSHLIAGTDDMRTLAEIWLSSDYKAQFAVSNTAQDLYIAYPVEYLS